MKVAYYNTHELGMPSFRAESIEIKKDDYLTAYNYRGNIIFVAVVEKVNRKGLQLSTNTIAPTRIFFHIPYSEYHALNANSTGHDMYIAKRMKKYTE